MDKKKAPFWGSIDDVYEAMKHAKKYPSLAEDMGTNARFIQYVLISILNKLGSSTQTLEKDYVGAFLGLNVELSSEYYVFATYNLVSIWKKYNSLSVSTDSE